MDRMLSKTKILSSSISLADLPPRDTVRWVSRRKAAVVAAVQAGVITLPDACARYALSVEEFLSWQRTVERHGTPGLSITYAKSSRQPGLHGDKKTTPSRSTAAWGTLGAIN